MVSTNGMAGSTYVHSQRDQRKGRMNGVRQNESIDAHRMSPQLRDGLIQLQRGDVQLKIVCHDVPNELGTPGLLVQLDPMNALHHGGPVLPDALGRVFKIPTEYLESISRRVPRKKRRNSGAYFERFCGEHGVKAAETRPWACP